MDLVGVIIAVVVAAGAIWFLTWLKFDARIRKVFIVIVLIALVIYLLQAFYPPIAGLLRRY